MIRPDFANFGIKLLTLVLVVFCLTPAFCATKSKTFINGQRMEIISGGKKIKFDGGASVRRDSSTLVADQLIQDKESNLLSAYGNVKIKTTTEIGEKLNARSQSAKYNMTTQSGELLGKHSEVVYISSDSLTNATLFANNIMLNKSSESISAFGDVEVITSSGLAKADRALFSQKEKQIMFSGVPRPLVVFDNGLADRAEILSDTATIRMGKKQAVFNGNVSGTINFKNDNNENFKKH